MANAAAKKPLSPSMIAIIGVVAIIFIAAIAYYSLRPAPVKYPPGMGVGPAYVAK